MAEWQFTSLRRAKGRCEVVDTEHFRRGWCPVHFSTGKRCTQHCADARAELAAIQREYDALWAGEIAA